VTALRHVLLLVQSATAGLVALAPLVLALAEQSPAALLLALVTGAVACVPLVVAAGLAGGRNWARTFGFWYELLLLLSGVANLVVLSNGDLVSLLCTVGLPLALLWMLLHQPHKELTADSQELPRWRLEAGNRGSRRRTDPGG
jgi:hypothetical protein